MPPNKLPATAPQPLPGATAPQTAQLPATAPQPLPGATAPQTAPGAEPQAVPGDRRTTTPPGTPPRRSGEASLIPVLQLDHRPQPKLPFLDMERRAPVDDEPGDAPGGVFPKTRFAAHSVPPPRTEVCGAPALRPGAPPPGPRDWDKGKGDKGKDDKGKGDKSKGDKGKKGEPECVQERQPPGTRMNALTNRFDVDRVYKDMSKRSLDDLYAQQDWDDLMDLPTPPPYDPRFGPLADSALDRLKDLDDPQYLPLLYKKHLWLHKLTVQKWATLRDTWNIKDWGDVLQDLGCDEQAFQALVLLAQQGPPGRAEANRLIWNFMKPGGFTYRNPGQVWMASIKRARMEIDRPPVNHQDWQAWTPQKALEGDWEVKVNFAPRNPEGNPTTYGAIKQRLQILDCPSAYALEGLSAGSESPWQSGQNSWQQSARSVLPGVVDVQPELRPAPLPVAQVTAAWQQRAAAAQPPVQIVRVHPARVPDVPVHPQQHSYMLNGAWTPGWWLNESSWEWWGGRH